MITFTVPAVPVAQPRPRAGLLFTKGGKRRAGIMRDEDHPVHGFKASVQKSARDAYQGPPLECVLWINLAFVLPRPKKFNRKKDDPGRLWCQARPDADNLAKSICDALNALTWRDDSQIARMVVTKFYAAMDEQPCVEVQIGELD